MLSDPIDEISQRLNAKMMESQRFANEFSEDMGDRGNVHFPEVKKSAKRFLPDPSLPLSLALLFEEQIILDLYPFKTEEQFVQRYGLLPRHLKMLVDQGALRLNIVHSQIEIPGNEFTVLESFEDAQVDYSPLVNSELIESELLYSTDQFYMCNPNWAKNLQKGMRKSEEKPFSDHKLIDSAIFSQLAEDIKDIEGRSRTSRSLPMQNTGATEQGLKNILTMLRTLGYDELVNNELYWRQMPGLSALSRLEEPPYRNPFSTINSAWIGQSYQSLVKSRNENTRDFQTMSVFPTDLTQTLIEFGGWREWTNQESFGGLHFRTFDPLRDSPDKYIEEYLDLRKEIQNSEAVNIYGECDELFRKKSVDQVAERRISDGTKANKELQEILGSYETVNRWSGTALKVSGATIAANAVEELAVPLIRAGASKSGELADSFADTAGRVGEDIPSDLRYEINSRAEETGLIDAVDTEMGQTTKRPLSGIGEVAINMTAQEVVEHCWRNYLWRPAKRGELELLSAYKLREYENKSEIRNRIFPFIITSELRKK